MALYKSTFSTPRVFAGITDPATGSTLVLEPGGTVELAKDPGCHGLVSTEGSEAERVAKLKGPEVNSELEAAGLPTDGKVDDRRTRLLEHLTGPDA